MSAALSRMGIEVSPTTCGRIMEANRRLYGLEKPQHAPREKLEMPFKAVRRHQFWSADSRYIEEHLLPDPKPVYILTIFENFSRMVLASAISPTQNQWDFLAVLAEAIRHYGAPEALVTDGGGQFYSAHALQFYDMLGIRKERIEPGEPWQNYAETLFGVQRRMADWSFEKAQTWEDLLAAHDTWMRDYNFQKVRHVGASRIPFRERRGWSTTSGSRDSPGWKTRRGQQHVTNASKRKKTLTPLAMQDPRDTVRARLPEPQFPAMQAYILR